MASPVNGDGIHLQQRPEPDILVVSRGKGDIDMTQLFSRGLLLVLASAVLPACLSGLNHPLRAKPGLYATATGGVMVPSGRVVGCHADCQEMGSGDATGPAIEVGVGAMGMVSEHVGLIGGIYGPGFGNQRGSFKDGGAVVATLHGLWQTPDLAVGAGVEVGSRLYGVKLTAAATLPRGWLLGIWVRG